MGKVTWTAEAELRVKDIHDYIAQDNLSAAQRTANGIYTKARRLAEHPKLGYRHTTDSGQEVRILLYGHYRIVYRILPDETIQTLGVFRGSLDMDRHLL